MASTPKSTGEPRQFRFRKGMTIGSVDAETDQRYLEPAFVDNGTLQVLSDTMDPRCVVVGRTGAGKTALLLQLCRHQRAIRINPEALSMEYLSGSTIIPHLVAADVHLNLFYKLLWRHVLVVELLREHFAVRTARQEEAFLTKLTAAFDKKKKRKTESIDYVRKWGSKFWEEPEARVKQIVQTLSDNLQADLGPHFSRLVDATGTIESNGAIRPEMQARAQAVVNRIQIRDLQEVLDVIKDDVLTDSQKPYFFVIDDLDRDWIEAEYTYDLVEALIDEAGEFAKISNVKVVVALRENIVDGMLERRPRERRGRQREKYENLFLRLHWLDGELIQVVDGRLNELIRGQYGGSLTAESVLPPAVAKRGRGSGIDFMLSRSFKRPRDVILFMNECIKRAADHKTITREVVREVDSAYSVQRLRSVVDEWEENYRGLELIIRAVGSMPDGFTLADLIASDTLMAIVSAGMTEGDKSTVYAELAALQVDDTTLANRITALLFRVGVLGIKTAPDRPVRFSYEESDLLGTGIPPGGRFYFHPSLYRVLAVANPHLEVRI